MAVVGVFAKAFVRDQKNSVIEGFAQSTHGLLHNAVFIKSAGAGRILMARNAEENKGFKAQIDARAHFLNQSIHTELIIAWHRGNFFFDAASRADKEGIDQVINPQRRLPNEGSQQREMTKTAQAGSRKNRLHYFLIAFRHCS